MGFKHLQRVRDEEKAAQELQVEVQERKQQLEDDLWKEVDDCIFLWKAKKRQTA